MLTKGKISVLAVIFLLLNSVIIFYLDKAGLLLQINGDADSWIRLSRMGALGISLGNEIWWPPLYPLILNFVFRLNLPLITISISQTIIFFLCLILIWKILSGLRCKIS